MLNIFVPDTDVSTTDMNDNFDDIGDALTASMATDGQSSMTGQFKGAAGTQAAPGWSWSSEVGSGWYRAGSGDFRFAVAGADVAKITSTGMTITGTLTATLAANSIVTASITDANVTTAKIADANVTTAKIADNAITAAKVSEGSGSLRSVPQSAKTTGYTLIAADNGRHISITTGGVTVPSGVFAEGDVISIYNNSGSSQTITQGSGVTMYLVGTATTGNRTLSQRGVATILCVASNTFVITGGGLS